METRASKKKTTSEDEPKEPRSPDLTLSPGSEITLSLPNLKRKGLRIESDTDTDPDYKPGDTSKDSDESTMNADSSNKDESLTEPDSNESEKESLSSDHQSSPPKSNYAKELKKEKETNEQTRKKKEEEKKEERKEKTKKSSNTNILKFLPIVGIVVGILLLHFLQSDDVPPENIVEMFDQEFSNLPTAYPHQNEKVWRVIRNTMRRHLKDQSPKEPVVIMIVSTPEAAEERENIAKEAAEKYSVRCQRNGPVVVYGNNYKRMDNAFAKEEIDKKITDAFQEDLCAAVISNFHMLPPASTTVFYQFCENDNAPFKNVSVIFTLEVEHGTWDRDQEYLQLRNREFPEPRSWDRIVEAFLYHNLENRDPSRVMTKDMISGLLSRITPSVVWVGPEPREGEL